MFFIDRLTKYADFFGISIEYKDPQVLNLIFKIFQLHGFLKNVVSDKDNQFLNTFWKELFHLIGTDITPSTSYHLQTDGKTKIVNKWLEEYLRNYVTS